MNRKELAEELKVDPWEIDDWLLKGCPAEKLFSRWNFNIQAVERWLKENRVRIRKADRPVAKEQETQLDWLSRRCPRCRQKGFSGEQAGLLCTDKEIVMGRWLLRRVGYPCGHSVEIFT